MAQNSYHRASESSPAARPWYIDIWSFLGLMLLFWGLFSSSGTRAGNGAMLLAFGILVLGVYKILLGGAEVQISGKGEAYRGRMIERSKNPSAYWSLITIHFVMAGLVVWLAVFLFSDPWKNSKHTNLSQMADDNVSSAYEN